MRGSAGARFRVASPVSVLFLANGPALEPRPAALWQWLKACPSAYPAIGVQIRYAYIDMGSPPDLQRLHPCVSSRLFRHPISERRGTKGLRAERAFWCMHAERAFSDGLDPGADKLRYHRAQAFREASKTALAADVRKLVRRNSENWCEGFCIFI